MSENENAKTQPSTLIACVGNMLLKDEGFGPYVAQVLTDYEAAREHFDDEHAKKLTQIFEPYEPRNSYDRIPVIDAGTMGMSMIPYFRDFDRFICIDIIDCHNSKIAPGSCFVLTAEDMAEKTVLHSLHDMRVIDVIKNAELAGYSADVVCICVQALEYAEGGFEIGLSDPVKNSVPVVVGALMEALGFVD